MPRSAALSIAILAAFSAARVARAQEEAEVPPAEVLPAEELAEEDAIPEAAPDPVRPRVAVLLLSMGGEIDPQVIDALNELLIGTIAARGGVTILGKEEFQAQLGQGDAGTLECVESMPCLGRVGVQLGVSEVVVGTLASREGVWVFNLNRVDVRSGTIVGRVFREVEGDIAAVADALNDAIPALYETPVRSGTLVVTSDVEGAEIFLDGTLIGAIENGRLRRENIALGEHLVRASAPGRTAWERRIDLGEGVETLAAQLPEIESGGDPRLHPVFWFSVGAAVLSLAVAIPLAISSQSQYELTEEQRWTMEVTRADTIAFYEDRTAEAIAANVLFVVSGLAAATAAVWLFLPVAQATDPPPDVDVAVGLGSIAIRGRFQ